MTVEKPESDEKRISDLEELQHNVHEFDKALNSTKERLEMLVESLKVNPMESPLPPDDSKIEMDVIPTNKISTIDLDLYRFTQILKEMHLNISYLEGVLK